MDGVLVHVNLGEHGVQMHEGAALGDIEGQHGADLGLGIGEQVAGRRLDGVGAGALGNADGQGVLGEVEHVAALDVGVEVAVVVALHQALEVGVVLEDIVGVDGLAAAGDGVHLMQEHAGAHAGKGVAGEVQVGHGVDHQVIRRGHQVLEGVGPGGVAHLLQGDALHGLFYQGLALEVGGQVLQAFVLPAPGLDIALEQPLAQEGLHQLGVQAEHVGHQVFQIDHLGAVVAQNLGEGVMLLLGNLEEGDIVKQKLSQGVGGQVQQLSAGTVQQHLFQRVDLASDTNAFHGSSLCGLHE